MLQFAHIEYSIQTKSLDIFSIGCDGMCQDCCNPEIKDWGLKGFGPIPILSKAISLSTKYNSLIDRIFLVGGDPVDAYKRYPDEYMSFIIQLKSCVTKPIYLFTRYELINIPYELIHVVDYIKTGPYIPELVTDSNIIYGIKLATSNQTILKVSEIEQAKEEKFLAKN